MAQRFPSMGNEGKRYAFLLLLSRLATLASRRFQLDLFAHLQLSLRLLTAYVCRAGCHFCRFHPSRRG